MKATLEFTWPDDPKEWLVAIRIASHGAHYRSTLRDVDAHVRNVLKYATATTDFRAELQTVRDMIREAVPDLDDDL